MDKKIGIIGAGVAGLAAAIRMAARGYSVDVFEKNEYPGGKLTAFRLGDFRFDAGPSLFTMPHYIDELTKIAGASDLPPFTYQRLETICHYFWEDGTRFPAFADPVRFSRVVQQELGVPAADIFRALEDSRRKYELTGRIFLEKSLHRAKTWLHQDVLRALWQIPSLDLFQSMHAANSRYFKHPKMVQLFDRYATYNGSNPYHAPGLLNIIPHFEYSFGAYFPTGGMHQITEHLVRLAKHLGVNFHFGQQVDRILVEKRRIKGIQVGQEKIPYSTVISNMDVFFTYQRLLADHPMPKNIKNQEKSTSALIFYWGIQQQFPELDLHNIFFSDHYQREFANLRKGVLDEDPTVYINISSKLAPQDAPRGAENWFVMINAPYAQGVDWEEAVPKAKITILRKLERILGQRVEPLIVEETVLHPALIESRTASHLGALYGSSSNNRMAAFLRHPNQTRAFENLYFCGGSVHPGGGIPLCLLSARIVDEIMHS